MKKIIYLMLSIAILSSCGGGLNRSIIEPLDVKALKKQMKADTTFTDFYKDVQDLRTWVMASDIRQAKYGDVTYARLKKFEKKTQDTTYINKLNEKYHAEYDVLYPDYSAQVDSVMKHWASYVQENSLDSLVTIEFSDLWKERYSYSGDIRSVNIGFSVTPLKGDIQQLVFRYCIKSKISSDGKMSILDSHRCLASSPIRGKKTLYWEADYSDEKYLKGKSSDEVKRDYDFIIEVVEVRVNGENMSEKMEVVPKYVKYALDDELFDGGYWKDDIITETIDPDHVSFWKFSEPKYKEDVKKVDPLVFEMLQENDESDED